MPFGLGNKYFIATTPSVLKLWSNGSSLCPNKLSGRAPQELPPIIPDQIDGQVHQCQLGNATYHVDFNYVNGKQHVVYNISDFHVITWEGNIEIGNDPGRPCEGIAPSDDVRVCWAYPRVMQTMAYQAISDAFTKQLAGSISVDYTWSFFNSSILGTSLGTTKELVEIARELVSESTMNRTIQSHFANLPVFLSQGLSSPHQSLHMSLIPALEALFQKAVVSLMSSELLQ